MTQPTSVGSDPIRFIAPCGTHWAVYEIKDPAAESGRALIFVSDAGFRRVRDYPADWDTLEDDKLWALSWNK